MICTTIQNKDLQGILDALEQCEMAEIRLDRCLLSNKDIDLVFSSDVPLVATCRIDEVMRNGTLQAFQGSGATAGSMRYKAAAIAEKRLIRAIEAGAGFVDVEIEAPKEMSKRVRQAAHENGAVFIRSFHDFKGTPSDAELLETIAKCRRHGADVVKLVTSASSSEDAVRVAALYGRLGEIAGSTANAVKPGELIAFAMGEAGKASRVDCLRMGAPYTYAALTEEEAAAPGQWPMKEMMEAVYGNFRFIGTGFGQGSAFCGQAVGGATGTQEETGECRALMMPASKSFAQRAIIAAALADGESRLSGYSPCSDSEGAIKVAEELGAKIVREDDCLVINGISAAAASLEKDSIHVGESGLLTRLMIPLSAQLGRGKVRITGEKTLLRRPLDG
ncbi:MAG: type I 3-dehydroquinate dehydratase, partial [Bacteroidales bacterium]|nr:type I 3-dehydroquinate dehydratase [Bacteroidales bacterium]